MIVAHTTEDKRAKAKERGRRWYEANKDKTKARASAWNNSHPEETSARYRKWAQEHPEEIKNHKRKWKKSNPEQVKEYNRRWHLDRIYGLTLEQFENMRAKQDDRCAICLRKRALVIDHNHATGKVRELLCGQCNKMIGLAHESPECLRAAARYLNKHGMKSVEHEVLPLFANGGIQ